MVLTRLSHSGELCPLRDHSYSDPVILNAALPSASKKCTSFQIVSRSLAVSSSSAAHSSSQTDLSDISLDNPAIYDIRESYHIFDLPVEILEKILSNLSFREIGHARRICKRFDEISANMLNVAFQQLQNEMLQRFQATKSQMPRRESARRKHPLAHETDILETLHMRLSLLQMGFGKHIERKHCCFFAGEILDEVHRILTYMKVTPTLEKSYKITEELYELCSMAMEYFTEHIEPNLPEITYFRSEFLDVASKDSQQEEDVTEQDSLPQSNMVLRKRIRRIRQGMKRYNTQLAAMKRDLKICKSKIGEQHKQLIDYAKRMEEYDKKFEESSRKYSTLLQDLNKCKTELQYWRSKSPAHPALCYSCGRSVGESIWKQNKIAGSPLMPLFGGMDYFTFPTKSSLALQSGSVKNLGKIFAEDVNCSQSSGSMDNNSSSVLGLGTSSLVQNLDVILKGDPDHFACHSHSPDEDSDSGLKKRSTSDDDSEMEDTVGRRVRERKRMKLEVQ